MTPAEMADADATFRIFAIMVVLLLLGLWFAGDD
jgi:hypothetical protein